MEILNLNLKKGEQIVLQLDNECLIGNIHFVGSHGTYLEIDNVIDFLTNQEIPGVQKYFKPEIRDIKIFDHKRDEPETKTLETVANVTKLNVEEMSAINRGIQGHIFINQTDEKYHKAMKYLRNQSVIAVNMECIGMGRHSHSPSLLSIATAEQIFILDIKWMKITADVKDILRNTKTRKIVHNSRKLCDILLHNYDVDLKPIFDTLVAHVATTKDGNKEEIDLAKCIATCFNLPDNFMDDSCSDFQERPLNVAHKMQAAKNVAFLFLLQEHFVHNIMLQRFYESCATYSKSLSFDCDFIDSIVKNTHGNQDLEKIEEFELNIQ